MSRLFEELDFQQTDIGAVSLRRRRELLLDVDVLEIKLDDEFLMSSLFTESERALARLGLEAVTAPAPAVLVGGLGLGYTAAEVLADETVTSLLVVEMLKPVIEWHEKGLLPLGAVLQADSRCSLLRGDFFELVRNDDGFDPAQCGRRYDAILLDIDHSPTALLDERSASFYNQEGLTALARQLVPGGIFGLWSNEAPESSVTARLQEVFAQAWSEPVTFHNPYQDRAVTQTVYLARTAR